jgi:hypothetical protein
MARSSSVSCVDRRRKGSSHWYRFLWEAGPKGSTEYEDVAAAVEEVLLGWSWLSIQNVSLSSSSVAWLLLNKRIPEALVRSK